MILLYLQSKRSKIFCILIVTACIFLFATCVSNIDENKQFEQDTYISIFEIRNHLAYHTQFEPTASNISSRLTTGEIILKYNFDLPLEVKFIKATTKETSIEANNDKGDKSALTHNPKDIIEVNFRTSDYEFTDYENSIWLASLITVLGYVVADFHEQNPRIEPINNQKAGKIFLDSLEPYLFTNRKNIENMLRHPLVQAYDVMLKAQNTLAIIGLSSNIINITEDSVKIVYNPNNVVGESTSGSE